MSQRHVTLHDKRTFNHNTSASKETRLKPKSFNADSLVSAENLLDELQKILNLDTASSLKVTDLNGHSITLTGDQIAAFKLGLATGVSAVVIKNISQKQPKRPTRIH